MCLLNLHNTMKKNKRIIRRPIVKTVAVYIVPKSSKFFPLNIWIKWIREKKTTQITTTRTIWTTAKTSRKIYWPNIFAGFILLCFVLQSSLASGMTLVQSAQANKSLWMRLDGCVCARAFFYRFLWTYCISWIIPMPLWK